MVKITGQPQTSANITGCTSTNEKLTCNGGDLLRDGEVGRLTFVNLMDSDQARKYFRWHRNVEKVKLTFFKFEERPFKFSHINIYVLSIPSKSIGLDRKPSVAISNAWYSRTSLKNIQMCSYSSQNGITKITAFVNVKQVTRVAVQFNILNSQFEWLYISEVQLCSEGYSGFIQCMNPPSDVTPTNTYLSSLKVAISTPTPKTSDTPPETTSTSTIKPLPTLKTFDTTSSTIQSALKNMPQSSTKSTSQATKSSKIPFPTTPPPSQPTTPPPQTTQSPSLPLLLPTPPPQTTQSPSLPLLPTPPPQTTQSPSLPLPLPSPPPQTTQSPSLPLPLPIILSSPPPSGSTVTPNLQSPESVTLSCSIGTPLADGFEYWWAWLRNEANIDNSGKYIQTEYNKSQSSHLEIADLQYSDAGYYMCLVGYKACPDSVVCTTDFKLATSAIGYIQLNLIGRLLNNY